MLKYAHICLTTIILLYYAQNYARIIRIGPLPSWESRGQLLTPLPEVIGGWGSCTYTFVCRLPYRPLWGPCALPPDGSQEETRHTTTGWAGICSCQAQAFTETV